MVATNVLWKCLVAVFLCEIIYVNPSSIDDLPSKIRCLDENCNGIVSQALVKEKFDSQDDHILITQKNELLQVLGKDADDGQFWLVKHFHTGRIGFAFRDRLKEVHVIEENPGNIVAVETVLHKIVVDKKPAANEQPIPPPLDDAQPDTQHGSLTEESGTAHKTPEPVAESVPAWRDTIPPVPKVSVEIPNLLRDQTRGENVPGNVEKQAKDGGGSTNSDNVNQGSTDPDRDSVIPDVVADQDPALEIFGRADGEVRTNDGTTDTLTPADDQGKGGEDSSNPAAGNVEDDKSQRIDPQSLVGHPGDKHAGHTNSDLKLEQAKEQNSDKGLLPETDSHSGPMADSLRGETREQGIVESKSNVNNGDAHQTTEAGVIENSPVIPESLPESSSLAGERTPPEKEEVAKEAEEEDIYDEDDLFDFDFMEEDDEDEPIDDNDASEDQVSPIQDPRKDAGEHQTDSNKTPREVPQQGRFDSAFEDQVRTTEDLGEIVPEQQPAKNKVAGEVPQEGRLDNDHSALEDRVRTAQDPGKVVPEHQPAGSEATEGVPQKERFGNAHSASREQVRTNQDPGKVAPEQQPAENEVTDGVLQEGIPSTVHVQVDDVPESLGGGDEIPKSTDSHQTAADREKENRSQMDKMPEVSEYRNDGHDELVKAGKGSQEMEDNNGNDRSNPNDLEHHGARANVPLDNVNTQAEGVDTDETKRVLSGDEEVPSNELPDVVKSSVAASAGEVGKEETAKGVEETVTDPLSPVDTVDSLDYVDNAESSIAVNPEVMGQEGRTQEDFLSLEKNTPDIDSMAVLIGAEESNPHFVGEEALTVSKTATGLEQHQRIKQMEEQDETLGSQGIGEAIKAVDDPSDHTPSDNFGEPTKIEVPAEQRDDGYDSGFEMSSDDEDDEETDGVAQGHLSQDSRQGEEEDAKKDKNLEQIDPTPHFQVIDGTTLYLQDQDDFRFEQDQAELDQDQLQPSHRGQAEQEVTATPPLEEPMDKVYQIPQGSDGSRDHKNAAEMPLETLDDFNSQGHLDPTNDGTKDTLETLEDQEDTFLATDDGLARANLKFTRWLSKPGNLDVVLDELAADNPTIKDDQKRLHMELSRMMNVPEWQRRMLRRLWPLFGDDSTADQILDPSSPPSESKDGKEDAANIVGDPRIVEDIPDVIADNPGNGDTAGKEYTQEEHGWVQDAETGIPEGTIEPELVDPYDFSSRVPEVRDDGGNHWGETVEESSTDRPDTEVHDTTTHPPAYQTDYPPPPPQDYTPPSEDPVPSTEASQQYQHYTEAPPTEAGVDEEETNKTYSLDEIMEIVMENLHSLYNVTMVTVLPLLELLPDEMKAVIKEPTFLGIPWMTLVWAEAALSGFFALLFCGCLCSARSSRAYHRELEMEVRSLTEQKGKALDGLKTTTKHFQDQNLEYHQFRQDMKGAEERNKGLVDMYETLKGEKDELDKVVAAYEKDSHKQQKELDGFRHKVSHQGDAHSKAQERIRTLQEETNELKARLSAYENDSVTLRQAVEAKDGEIRQLSEAKDELTEEVRKRTHQSDDLVAEVALLRENNGSLTSSVTDKDNEIEVLKDCLIKLKGIEDYGEGTEVDNEARILQLLDVNRANAKISLLEEERKKQEEKMETDSMKIHELEDNNKSLHKDIENLQQEYKKSTADHDEARTKLEVLTEYFKNKEVEMQRKLGKEEALKFHSQKELDTLGEKSAAAEAELSNYQQQIKDLKDEIEKSERSFRQQVAAHEKKAHESWLASRNAERKLRETNKEVASLRQRLTELQGRKVSDNSPLIKPAPGRMTSPSNASEASMMTRDQPSRNSILGDAPSPPIIGGGQRQSPSDLRDRPPSRPLRVSRQGRPPSFHEDFFPPEDMMPPPDMPFPMGPPGPFLPGMDPYGPPPMDFPPPGMDFDGPPPPGYGPPGPYDFDPHGPLPPFMGPHPDDFGPEGPFPGMDPTMGPPPFRGPPPPSWDNGRMLPPGVRGPPPPGSNPGSMRRPSSGIPPQQGHLEANQGPRTSSPLDPEATEVDGQNQARPNTRGISQQP